MDYYQYLVQKLGEIVLENGQMNYILYPFGHLGALTKGILNGLYGVSEKAIIDNILCDKYDNIKDLSYLDGMEPDGCKILITSDNINCYEEIRDKLYTVVKKEQCVELFPVPPIILAHRKKKADIIKKMDDEKVKETFTYHPKKTKSDFYLPLLPTDYIQYTILMTDDYYERSTLEKVFSLYKNGIIKERMSQGTVLDIGANIGNHTLYFCNECNAKKVHCFEPTELTFSILEKNISLNHLEQRTKLWKLGVGATEGRASTAYNIYNIGGNHLHLNESGEVLIKRLDDLNITDEIVFIKIDVEEMEDSVIRGGMSLIGKNKPYIMMESFEDKVHEIKRLLSDLGYSCECLDSSGNWLFVPGK